MLDVDFVAIDFETAGRQKACVCEAGICVVAGGEVTETRSWLIRPEGNSYSYWNIRVHGIRPEDTADAPEFPEVWDEISEYLQLYPALVAHNAAFDMNCIRNSLDFYGLPKPDITYYCSLRAARRLYDFRHNTLDVLCNQFEIPYIRHHRAGDDAEMCARLFLRELKDAGWLTLPQMSWCSGKL